ncbi:MAG: YraN family protein [Rikenellaceae bacterium]
MKFSTQKIGGRGEELALEFLLKEGFHILDKNFRAGSYELDIVAFKDSVLHIVEVKTRKKDSLTSPEDAFSKAKFNALVKGAKIYLKQNDFDYELQFDLIAVEYDGSEVELRYIPEVMSPGW